MDDKLTVKTAKFTSLENLYVYGIYHHFVQLSSEYREKKKLTDNLKEDLQIKINEYTKFAEQGKAIVCAFY